MPKHPFEGIEDRLRLSQPFGVKYQMGMLLSLVAKAICEQTKEEYSEVYDRLRNAADGK